MPKSLKQIQDAIPKSRRNAPPNQDPAKNDLL